MAAERHVFLTGGTGFIGRHVLAALLDAGHRVTVLRHPVDAPISTHPRLAWLGKAMDQLTPTDLDGMDALVHLASPGVPPQQATWQTLFYWNVTVLLQLLEVARAAGVRRAVLAGTFAEYGRSADAHAFIPADAPLAPTYGYAASKAAGFQAAHAHAIEHAMELCYLRIFSVFGEGQYVENFWPALRLAASQGRDFPMTPGAQVRDYVPVPSVARAFLHAVERRDVRPGMPWVRNVGSGQPVSMQDFAARWWSRWNAAGRLLVGALPYRPNEVMRCVPEIADDLFLPTEES
ncbi:NAD-dependent epimerase/dehydratase family protein [Paracidovorax anthurii]|uniref:dTDP-glucose 4,6-dehydratase/dTDP-6-deoxy-L-talose 4-dehydrogenase (NAD+) n=1 Tax=Paracidovorax anthurii TaxID=78229 RepID=A0A328ZCH5_9BURK|nr:NAD(P)-dependent oxidoreductase [Paracidovorax anthurii]RAR79996.1 dTDP-glucose 4,6-dehydratase/dTDP-6-deoxy-L-talose 4-dehydrogenase (NAD+) [Paracidovorax anthurii]